MAETAVSDPTDVPSGVPEDRVDPLYALPLDEFTPARDALAKERRREGDRGAAEWVKGLRKPSAPAWVVNQLARTQGREARELESAGQALREAHERLLAGDGQAHELSEAAARQDKAVAALVDRAAGLLDRSGNPPSPATLEKARQTLEAIALDDDARTAFGAGRLTRELRPVGLGLMTGGRDPSGARQDPGARDDRRERAADDVKKRAELRKAFEAAKHEERTEQRAVELAEHEVEQARQDVDRAQARLKKAEDELGGARAQHQEATRRVEDLEKTLGKRA